MLLIAGSILLLIFVLTVIVSVIIYLYYPFTKEVEGEEEPIPDLIYYPEETEEIMEEVIEEEMGEYNLPEEEMMSSEMEHFANIRW